MYHLLITEIAKAEIAEAVTWYNEQRSGLGADFLEELSDVLTDIEAYPERFSIKFLSARVARMKRFPYMIFFEVMDNGIIVFQLIHNRRDPGKWRKGG